MDEQKRERWQELCADAQTEQDQEKFTEIMVEINRLLKEKEDSRTRPRPGTEPQVELLPTASRGDVG